jgi:hypothetical protein
MKNLWLAIIPYIRGINNLRDGLHSPALAGFSPQPSRSDKYGVLRSG